MRYLLAALLLPLVLLIVLIVEVAVARRSGAEAADYRNPAVNPQLLVGGGAPLTYVVLGDSTAAGQGAPYEQGIALTTAHQLAQGRTVRLFNFAVSGARLQDVLRDQLPRLHGLAPDLVLISAGSNDVTAWTRASDLGAALQQLADGLTALNSDVRCVVTGAGDLGAIPRLPQPLRWFAGLRTRRVNRIFKAVAERYGLTLAPVAERTGPTFARRPELFSQDRFHPNGQGYALWSEVIIPALQEALARNERR